MKRFALVVVSFVVLAAAAAAQVPNPENPKILPPPQPKVAPPDPVAGTLGATIDLAPGDAAPGFALESSLGGEVKRADLAGGWYVLVFDPSFAALAPLHTVMDTLLAIGVRPFGVCRDRVTVLRSIAARQHLAFPLLSDPTGEISQLFDMYDDANESIRPGLVLVDGRGTVRMLVQAPSLHPDEVLAMVRHTVLGA